MTAQLLATEVLDELRGIAREPTALFFSIGMPVGFFVLFVTLFGGESSGGAAAGGMAGPAGTTMVATFGTFGVLSVALMNPGIGIAEDRERGWLRAKRVTAVPVGVMLTAKVAAALPYAVGVLAAMAVASALTGVLDASPAVLLRLAGVLVLGALPFALLGLAVGFRAGSNAAAAVLNAILLPSAVLSGLWMPLEILPDVISRIAVFLPTYHLAELGVVQLYGGEWVAHAGALAGFTVVAAGLAVTAYRHARL